MSATVTAFVFSPLRLRFGWSFGEGVVAAPPRPRHRSGSPHPSASFVPARPAPGRITPRCCRLIVTAWGWHRFSASSPAVVHLRFAPDHFFRLRLRSPIPEERGTGNEAPTKNLIGTLPPDPLPPFYAGEGAGCRLAKVFCLIRRRHPPRRVPPQSGSRLFTASRLLLQREAAIAPDASDTVAAGVACVWYSQHHRQPIR